MAPYLELETEGYPYLSLWTPATRRSGFRSRIVSEGVLVVCALCEDGFREILAIEVADVESKASKGGAGDF